MSAVSLESRCTARLVPSPDEAAHQSSGRVEPGVAREGHASRAASALALEQGPERSRRACRTRRHAEATSSVEATGAA